LIYDLAKTRRFKDEIVQALQPEQFRELAVLAEKVPTSLWSNNDEELRNLVACGQVTTCFNLLHYIMKERSDQLNTSGSREEEIYNRALAAWKLSQQSIRISQKSTLTIRLRVKETHMIRVATPAALYRMFCDLCVSLRPLR
jgi:hypothetical protein